MVTGAPSEPNKGASPAPQLALVFLASRRWQLASRISGLERPHKGWAILGAWWNTVVQRIHEQGFEIVD
jgi:hypothetical protein